MNKLKLKQIELSDLYVGMDILALYHDFGYYICQIIGIQTDLSKIICRFYSYKEKHKFCEPIGLNPKNNNCIEHGDLYDDFEEIEKYEFNDHGKDIIIKTYNNFFYIPEDFPYYGNAYGNIYIHQYMGYQVPPIDDIIDYKILKHLTPMDPFNWNMTSIKCIPENNNNNNTTGLDLLNPKYISYKMSTNKILELNQTTDISLNFIEFKDELKNTGLIIKDNKLKDKIKTIGILLNINIGIIDNTSEPEITIIYLNEYNKKLKTAIIDLENNILIKN